MAKPFYSIDEVCQKLGKTESEIRDLVRDGALREFRDAGKVFFKAEDVDRLAGGGAGDSGEITLAAADDEIPSLTDASSGTSIIGLQPVGEEEPEPKKEDTAVVSSSGIGVFDDDELDIDADPMAATQVTDASMDDQVQLDSSGSGSGLLDLTREADDTSLGAELLDDISAEYESDEAPEERPAPKAAPKPAAKPVEEPAADIGEPLAPVMAAPVDATEGVFGGMLVAAMICLTFAGCIAAAVTQGFVPNWLSSSIKGVNFWFYLLGAVGVTGFSILLGWVFNRAFAGPRR